MTASIRTDCRMCGGALQQVLDLGWTPLGNALCAEPCTPRVYPLMLARCVDCGHFQLPVQVDPAELFPANYPYASGASASMRTHLDGVAAMLADKLPLGARVLEVGSNDGYLLDKMQEQGLSVVGVDPAASPASIRNHAVICEPWGGERRLSCLADESFDAVVGLNVFAHVADLRRSMAEVLRVLKHGGLFMMEVGYFGAMVEQNVFDTIYHEHLDYHTLHALVPFLARCGLTVFDVERIPVQGGSIRVWARRGEAEQTANLRGLMNVEYVMLHRPATYIENVLRYSECIQDQLETKNDLVGYGCPAKAMTLLTACDKLLEAFIDDSPLKVGKYAPDGRTPILANSAELDDLFPDGVEVVLFAWNMADEVMGRLKASPARCLREARVLVPFPEPHWLAPATS